MANCAIYIKGYDLITYFIRDCIQTGRDFHGSNGSVTGVKEHLFDTFWTDDIVSPICDKEERQTGYDKSIKDLIEAKRYNGVVVSTPVDVDAVTRNLISAKYPDSDEKKIHRLKMAGGGEKEFKEYNSFVDNLVSKGREFKKKMEGVIK
jgi:hypothetical protein